MSCFESIRACAAHSELPDLRGCVREAAWQTASLLTDGRHRSIDLVPVELNADFDTYDQAVEFLDMMHVVKDKRDFMSLRKSMSRKFDFQVSAYQVFVTRRAKVIGMITEAQELGCFAEVGAHLKSHNFTTNSMFEHALLTLCAGKSAKMPRILDCYVHDHPLFADAFLGCDQEPNHIQSTIRRCAEVILDCRRKKQPLKAIKKYYYEVASGFFAVEA